MTEKEIKDCGCGHDHDEELEEEYDVMVITLDDGKEMECAVLGVFDLDDKDYIALVPVNEEDGEDAFIYKYTEIDGENVDLQVIEDEAEFDKVAAEFTRLMDMEDEEE